MQIQQKVSDLEGFQEKWIHQQVVAPKGLDIFRPTTSVLPNYFLNGKNQYLEHFGTATDKAAYFRKSWTRANSILLLWILAIYAYISSFMQIQQKVSDLGGFKEKWNIN